MNTRKAFEQAVKLAAVKEEDVIVKVSKVAATSAINSIAKSWKTAFWATPPSAAYMRELQEDLATYIMDKLGNYFSVYNK